MASTLTLPYKDMMTNRIKMASISHAGVIFYLSSNWLLRTKIDNSQNLTLSKLANLVKAF